MYNFTNILAKNIKRLRKELGLSQMQLSLTANISLAFINAIENEQKWVSPKTLAKLCKALNIKPYELFMTDDVDSETLEIIADSHEKMLTEIKDIINKYTKDK